jgi:hypothetical protein
VSNEAFIGPVGSGTNAAGNDPNMIKMTFNRGSIKYDNPFLDITSTYIPITIKGMFKFVAAFALGDGIISQCIIKMSEYPITKLIYNDDEKSKFEDDKTIDWWKNVLEKQINIMRVLKECGMDYYAYGNSIISISFPFRRQLQCPRCQEWHNVEAMEIKFRAYQFYAKCKCGYDGHMKARDLPTKEIAGIKIIKWDLPYVDIKYNNISGDHFYYYTPPENIKNAIRRGDMDIVNTTRLEIIEAIKKNKQLKLTTNNIYHQKRSAPQYIIPSERGWGVPLIMPVMKDVFHVRILKKGNEMICFDHIVPLRMLFPTSQGDVSPHLTTNLTSWRSKVEDQIMRWRKDPNYIAIVPMPIGTQTFGGDGKILMVTPEIKAVEDDIVIGMGVIPELIRGGASWSGSNVSLRIVENTFLNHRGDMQNIIDFIIDKVSTFFGKNKIPVKMADFKMADDLQKKQMMVNAAMGPTSDALISRPTAIKELGFDPDVEYDNNQAYLKKIIELKTRESEGMAEAQGAGSVINALYQADAQMENQKRMEMHQKNMQMERQQDSEQFKAQNAQAAVQDTQAQNIPQNVDVPTLIYMLTARFARLAQVDQTEFKIRMLGMKQAMPALYNEVFRNLQEMNLIAADLLPDLAIAQKETPGQVPSNTQGDVTANEPPSPVEQASVSGVAQVNSEQDSKVVARPLPEQRPPKSDNAGI